MSSEIINLDKRAGSQKGPPPIDVPRGVSPKILLDQLRNTIPFLFDRTPPLQPIRHDHLRLVLACDPQAELSHAEYFELCTAAHHASVCSFVPTDVDNQIRFKLWHPSLPDDTIHAMADANDRSFFWDCSFVSTRWIPSPIDSGNLSGLQGEWFSTAVAAYGALRHRDTERARAVCEAVLKEVEREAAIYLALEKKGDGIALLKAATIIAHNLGDLDRVVDMWHLEPEDPLRMAAYKGGHIEKAGLYAALTRAGLLNKAFMVDDNHRHFALRPARGLRKSADFLLPIGPFFDDWGRIVGRHPDINEEELGVIVQCLVDGWERLQCAGYARALAGIESGIPGGLNRLCQLLAAKTARVLKAGPLRQQISVPQPRFEAQWNARALKFNN